MKERPFEVVRSTGTAVQVRGSPTLYHLSHCVKAPKEEQNTKFKDKKTKTPADQERGLTHQKHKRMLNIKIQKKRLTMPRTLTMLGMMPTRTYQLMSWEKDSVSSICNTCQEQRWPPPRKAIQQRLNDYASRRKREAVVPRRPRSVRKKTKPKRYVNEWSNPG